MSACGNGNRLLSKSKDGSSSLPAGAKQIDMKVQSNDIEYLVQWLYHEDTETTSCVIRSTASDPIVDIVYGSSNVKRYYKDKPSMVSACQYALAKALKETKFPKEVRTTFWEKFLERKPTGWFIS